MRLWTILILLVIATPAHGIDWCFHDEPSNVVYGDLYNELAMGDEMYPCEVGFFEWGNLVCTGAHRITGNIIFDAKWDEIILHLPGMSAEPYILRRCEYENQFFTDTPLLTERLLTATTQASIQAD